VARDYAKGRSSGSSARRGSSKSKSKPLPGWIWLVFGLSIGLVIAAVVYIARPRAPAVAAPVASAPAPKPQASGKIPLPPKQPSRFSFYEMLPSYEVVIPREDAKASMKSGKATTADIAQPGQYLIQVGSYRSREEADRSRASLALLGVESRIEQVTIDQKQTWFRVRVGPESSLARAQEILDRLDQNGVKGILVKVKTAG
jgi:cell division protein FtsN